MGFFSSIGNAIKGVGHLAGKVLSNPIVEGASAFIPGVGPLITAGEGALGGLLKPGGNFGSALTGGLQGAAAGAAGGTIRKLGTGILSNGLGSTIKGIAGGTMGGMMDRNGIDGQGGGGGGAYGNIIDYDAGGNPIYAGDQQGGGSWQDAILGGARKLGSGLLGGGSTGSQLGNLAIGGLAGYQALNAANASKRAGQLSDKAIGLAESRWNDAAPLRSAGQARLLNPTRPDLTSVYQDPTNPFAARPLAPAAPAPSAAPSIQSLTQAPGGVLRKLQLARGS
jgi:hypothetical protein